MPFSKLCDGWRCHCADPTFWGCLLCFSCPCGLVCNLIRSVTEKQRGLREAMYGARKRSRGTRTSLRTLERSLTLGPPSTWRNASRRVGASTRGYCTHGHGQVGTNGTVAFVVAARCCSCLAATCIRPADVCPADLCPDSVSRIWTATPGSLHGDQLSSAH